MRKSRFIIIIHLKSLFLAIVGGGGGGGGEISKRDAIISHEQTTVTPFYPSFHFFSPSFACLHPQNLLCSGAVT
jgi:hypothetical protein